MRKLLETLDLVQLYTWHVGKREVPESFDEWACISLIAACVGNRVWYEKWGGAKLHPNLYVVLVGPSAVGKGVAIDDATNPYVAHVPLVSMYRGKATPPFIVDLLNRNPCLYLVTPELSLSVGSGPLAVEFVKMMTELFTGGAYKYQHGTRIKGNVTFRGHVINWLGASTEEWMMSALSKEDVEGGPLGRIVAVREGYRRIRIPRPERSPDYEELRRHIQARVYNLLGLQGQFVMTKRAEFLHDQWYYERDDPNEGDGSMPTWRRQDDLIIKLAMIRALASGRHDLLITADDFTEGKNLSDMAIKSVPALVAAASATPETSGLHHVRAALVRAGEIQRQALVKKMAKRGILASKLQEFIGQLREEGVVEEVMSGRSMVYKWKGRSTL